LIRVDREEVVDRRLRRYYRLTEEGSARLAEEARRLRGPRGGWAFALAAFALLAPLFLVLTDILLVAVPAGGIRLLSQPSFLFLAGSNSSSRTTGGECARSRAAWRLACRRPNAAAP
jgi:hypothetical protein